MKPRAFAALLLTLLLAPVGCAERASTSSAASPAWEAGDGGEPTCEERARSRPMCTSAVTSRCQSQMNDCESTCEGRASLPANTEKVPSGRIDMEAARCRDTCRVAFDACLRQLLARCPALCAP